MEFQKNESGYALVIVLLVVVFVMIVSAVFMRGSLSNAKQEQIVDQNNLAVVAAEMGVDYYVTHLKNAEIVILKDSLLKIKDDLATYNKCRGVSNNSIPGCSYVSTIKQIKEKAKTNYLGKMQNEVSNIKTINTINKEIIPNDDSFSFQILNNQEKDLWNGDNEIKVNLEIVGSSKAKEPKTLVTELTFKLPDFIGQKSESPLTTVDSIFNSFSSTNLVKEIPCYKNNKCTSGSYYTKSYYYIQNQNNLFKLSNLFWVHDGFLELHNANNWGKNAIVIARSFKIHGANNMDGSLVLLGEEHGKGTINNLDIKFSNNGKLCVNIDGFPRSDLESLRKSLEKNKDSTKHVFLFSASESPTWPTLFTEYQKVTGVSLEKFVNDCVGRPVVPNYGNGNYEKLDIPTDILVDVIY